MKAGSEINCPHCGKNSFLKKVPILEGWAKKGDILVCAACSAKIADLPKDEEKAEIKDKAVNKFASFLKEEKKDTPKILSGEDDKKFCKDCVHFIKHPFNDKCSLHDKFINPMDDCNDFRKRKS